MKQVLLIAITGLPVVLLVWFGVVLYTGIPIVDFNSRKTSIPLPNYKLQLAIEKNMSDPCNRSGAKAGNNVFTTRSDESRQSNGIRK
jgi:hypothetical protein